MSGAGLGEDQEFGYGLVKLAIPIGQVKQVFQKGRSDEPCHVPPTGLVP